MPPKTLVIVGGVAGGASAAARARRLSEEAKIIIFERGPYVSFANCGLPYFVGGEISLRDALLLHTPESLKARFNIDARVKTEVTAINRDRHLVKVRETESGREYEQHYDELILSTGSVPVIPPIPGINRPGHFVLRNVPDAEQIVRWLDQPGVRKAVVVGGGYIGLEMTEQLRRRGLEVALVEALPQVLTQLDPEMAGVVAESLRSNGITLFLDNPVTAFEEPARPAGGLASTVVLKDGKKLPADIVILALGVRPETSLAQNAGLQLGPTGGIKVNEFLQTTDPHVWAVGDAIEVRDLVTGQWTLVPLAGPASRQGRVAANNVFGYRTPYHGTLNTAIVRVFGLAAACTGATEKSLRRAGIQFEAVHLHPPSHATYYPGAAPLSIKIIFDRASGRLLGAQVVGRNGVDKRIDVLATAIRSGLTVDELAELDLAYAPPFGSAKDPINLAGMAAQNVMSGHTRQVQWSDLDTLDRSKVVLVDVRTPEERSKGFIPGSIHIPLVTLRSCLSSLPKEKEIIVYCQSGQRSYYALRILAQAGYSVRNLSGSYLTWKYSQSNT
ncbi:MAG: FAD-dependent oxidoreductase [Verrucomicrobiae bacterium]|nr:FAD-dependent oxidoreductase [Verrucomicrobiae bacterium]